MNYLHSVLYNYTFTWISNILYTFIYLSMYLANNNRIKMFAIFYTTIQRIVACLTVEKFALEIECVSSATSAIAAVFHFLWYLSFAPCPSFAPLFSSCRLNRISKQFITPTPGAHLYPYQRSLVAPCKRLLLQVEPPTSQQPTLTSGNNRPSSLA